ncbi:hypothetical protein BAE44_0006417, partial [Dichanthelium oligosanthes]
LQPLAASVNTKTNKKNKKYIVVGIQCSGKKKYSERSLTKIKRNN